MSDKMDYHQIVNYGQADPAKVLAQKAGLATIVNLPDGYEEVAGTRGESAYAFKMGDRYGALVQEGLGTKSVVAQKVYETSGKSHFSAVAQDTVACIINDLVSVGARPIVLNAYWSSSSYDWLTDSTLTTDFITGWRQACDEAGVVWGGGETQALADVVVPGALEFAGSAFGVIDNERQLIQGKNLKEGDAIVLVESNGVHANGISLIRQIAGQLPQGYATKLSDGRTFGEAVLQPSHIYAALGRKLFDAGLEVHYLSNITGHGWRKLMRAERELTYRVSVLPPVSPLLEFIAAQAGNDEKEMYGNYNMGAGYAVYVPAEQAEKVVELANACGLQAWKAGKVEQGPKQVIIEPNNITFTGDTLGVR